MINMNAVYISNTAHEMRTGFILSICFFAFILSTLFGLFNVDEPKITLFRIYAKFFFNFFIYTKNSATDSQKSR